ncbi:hypothetical protein GTP55_19410 [Duganella sp. FT109W]|uniref:Uncharacterized protein n=1 Tax=Duganella margarita TaxID=2692170 RepID=A0ABW9WK09_9BURK|nr:hypothetical protein [Duganella margarita]MYN41536.1 hypothetical protein [Duganella margarita]
MEKQMAAELMQEVLKLTAQLNVIIHKIHKVTPESDRQSLDRHILRHYPELDPHR